MSLDNAITDVLQLTQRLESAVDKNEIDSCHNLLEQRHQALKNLARIHENASPGELDLCQGKMRDLVEQDQAIRDKCEGIFTELGNNRDKLRNVRHAPKPAGPACINRKA